MSGGGTGVLAWPAECRVCGSADSTVNVLDRKAVPTGIISLQIGMHLVSESEYQQRADLLNQADRCQPDISD